MCTSLISRIACLGILLLSVSSFAANNMTDNSILPQPTGAYSVGFQDAYWLNKSVCPDPFYNGTNAKDFNSDNTQFCRQMMVRIYYPSLAPKRLATPYDSSAIQQYKDYIIQALPTIPTSILNSLDTIKTWDTRGAPLASGDFPVVIFSPGDMTNENDYAGHIDELVSQGYIVIALNNTFMSASVTFPNGPTVINDNSTDPARRTPTTAIAVHADTNFVLKQLFSLHETNKIFKAMELNNIGIMGHSLGADMSMYLGHMQPYSLKAVISLDSDALTWLTPLYQNYRFKVPFMSMHADSWYSYGNPQSIIHINNNSYFIVLTQMGHMNFADEGLFPYQETFKYAISHSKDFYNQLYPANGYQLGHINGSLAMRVENAYIIQFFNAYLKGAPLGWLASPVPYSPIVTGHYIGPAKIHSHSWPNRYRQNEAKEPLLENFSVSK